MSYKDVLILIALFFCMISWLIGCMADNELSGIEMIINMIISVIVFFVLVLHFKRK